MRHTLAAAAVAMLASSGSAFAADCTKGLLWPYVRNPGDCLTDQEVKTGVYMGAPQNGVAAGNSSAPAQQVTPVTMQDCHESGIWPFRSEECTSVVTTSATNAAAAGPKPAAPTPVAQSAAPVVQPAAAPAAASVATQCSKGLLWPFVRDSGDCPTNIERGHGTTTAAAAPAVTPALQPAVVTQTSPVAAGPAAATPAAMPAAITQTSAAPASCGKGIFWPFVRDDGDCQTAVEKPGAKSAVPVQTSASTATAPTAMPAVARQTSPVAASAAAPAQAAAPATTSCGKGLFWPFIRDSGDCATAAEKPSGASASAPASSSQPVVVPASATTPPPATESQPAAAPADSGGCHKGLFWPFVREPGDCPTSAGTGQTH